MVTRLLHACGLYLGREEELAGPALDNPEGFWENLNFVSLNEEILTRFGGRWDAPPAFPARWEFTPAAEELLGRAGDLRESFSQHTHWGWKDPRSSLTIPFWLRVIPSLKFIICVRNPLEVARSLFVRGDATSASHFHLWLHYYRQILSHAPPSARIVTHYQSYFENPRAELRRLTRWLGLEVTDEALERACAHISGRLRHHQIPNGALKAAGASREVTELYLQLCDEAGPLCRQHLENEAGPGAPAEAALPDAHVLQLMRMDNRLARMEERLRLLDERDANLEAQLTELRATLIPLIRLLDALRGVKRRLASLARRGPSGRGPTNL